MFPNSMNKEKIKQPKKWATMECKKEWKAIQNESSKEQNPDNCWTKGGKKQCKKWVPKKRFKAELGRAMEGSGFRLGPWPLLPLIFININIYIYIYIHIYTIYINRKWSIRCRTSFFSQIRKSGCRHIFSAAVYWFLFCFILKKVHTQTM